MSFAISFLPSVSRFQRQRVWLPWLLPLLCSLLLPAQSLQAKQTPVLDSLHQCLQRPNDTVKVAVLSELCFRYGATQPDTAIYFGKKALELAEQLHFPQWVAQACNDLGMVYHRKGSYGTALQLYQRSLALRQQLGNEHLIAASLSKIGNVYTDQAKYPEALKATLEALKQFEKLGEVKNQAYSYNNLGRLLERQQQFDQAIEYRKKAYELAEKIGDNVGMAGALQGIAVNYQNKGQQQEATRYFLQSLEIIKASGDKNNIAAALNNVGHSYHQQHDEVKAQAFFREALAISEEISDKHSSTLYRLNLADVFKNQGQYDKALAYSLQALEVARNEHLINLASEAYARLSDVYARTGDFKRAYQYLTLHEQLKDSLLNEASLKTMAEMQTRFETEQKEAEINLLHKEKKIQGLQLAKTEIERMELLIALVAVLLLALAAFFLLRLSQRHRLHQALLEEHTLRMKAIIDTQEAERKRIASDLHDSLGQILCLAQMNLSVLREDHSDHDPKWERLDELLRTSIKETRGIAHSMMPAVLVKLGLQEALTELTDYLSSAGRLPVSLEISGLTDRLTEDVEVAVYRIVQELVTNALKHAQAQHLLVRLERQPRQVRVLVQDDGQGFNAAALAREGGNGWSNLQSRVNLLNGTLQLKTAPGEGTTVEVLLPVAEQAQVRMRKIIPAAAEEEVAV